MVMAQNTLCLALSLILLCLIQWTLAMPAIRPEDATSFFSETKEYPLPNQGHVQAHDPNIIEHNNEFYLYKGAIHISIFKASSLDGPWQMMGTVLDEPSVIQKENRTRPWAPTTVQWKGKFYCFYTISQPGVRDSAIGVASTDSIDGNGGAGSWTDHGALISTGTGPLSHIYPYTQSNAIDASFMADQKTGQPYLLYGSFWHGIFQLPLTDHLLSVKNKQHPDAAHLTYLPDARPKPQEGSFMSYRKPYYYLWFSHGRCCGFHNGFPSKGTEYVFLHSGTLHNLRRELTSCRYSIRVGRSKDIRGPFLDKSGNRLTDGGGTTVYGSNHGVVYAPGGIGVLPGNNNRQDIMYYHYRECVRYPDTNS